MAWKSNAVEVIFLDVGSLTYNVTRSRMSFLYSGSERAMTTYQKPVGRVFA